MAFSKPPLNCWVVLHSHGGVACGHCDCIGGYVKTISCTTQHSVIFNTNIEMQIRRDMFPRWSSLVKVVNISEETCTSTIQRWHNKNSTKHPVSIAFIFYTMKHVKHVQNFIYFQELPTTISQL